MTTDSLTLAKPSDALLQATRQSTHCQCWLCGQNQHGLGVQFQLDPRGQIQAQVHCPASWRSYDHCVHGGIVAALLDGAMTHCLFAHGIIAVTADLQVRYRHPLQINIPALITGHLVRQASPIFHLEARVIQNDLLISRATAKFMKCQPAKSQPGVEP